MFLRTKKKKREKNRVLCPCFSEQKKFLKTINKLTKEGFIIHTGEVNVSLISSWASFW